MTFRNALCGLPIQQGFSLAKNQVYGDGREVGWVAVLFQDASHQNAQLGAGAFPQVPVDRDVLLELLD